ncbi:MAG: glycosyl hydrolase [Planctomycetes bacterium]|nr:glycosyl hydrolase [Planctomycetota bacterium]
MPKVIKRWPEKSTPKYVGRRVSEEVLPRLQIRSRGAHHCEDAMWVSMLRYAKKVEDQALLDRVVGQFDPMLTPEGEALISDKRHVDHSLFGIVPLELYAHTQDSRYLAMGQALADRQWEFPDANGLSGETRLWIDDLYMITVLQVQAFHATGDPVYLDRAALQMVAYLDKLQRPNGLFYHGPDAPFFWGRGNGWAAAGMVELLLALPRAHPRRVRIMESYLEMMASLLSYQDDDGMWHQLIDYKKSYRESSCTAMFTYAIIQGIKHEWLSADDYGQAARNGWFALVDRVDEQGRLEGVCVGTGKRSSLAYYLDRPRQTGEPHGQAAMLWCILTLL